MNKLLDSLKQEQNSQRTVTAKGAGAHATMVTGTNDAEHVLDFYANVGANRGNAQRSHQAWLKALAGHPLLAVRALFYLRDPRGGVGERDLFRYFFMQLAEQNDAMAASLVRHIPEFGRWDDLTMFFSDKSFAACPLTTNAAVSLATTQLAEDMQSALNGEAVSLCAKWMPSWKTSSKATRTKAVWFAGRLGMSLGKYNRTLVTLRQAIRIIETKISNGEWSNVDYNTIPAKAHMIYKDAFMRHDSERYSAWLASLSNPDSGNSIKATSLMAYEFAAKYGVSSGWSFHIPKYDATLEAQWEQLIADALVDLDDMDEELNALCCVDNSGSMYSAGYHGGNSLDSNMSPATIGNSIALYIASVVQGPFHNVYMTFDDDAKIKFLPDSNLKDKLNHLFGEVWKGGTTNVQSAYMTLLRHAVKNDVPEKDMPNVIVILSDMQFDSVGYGRNRAKTIMEDMREKYANAGYKLPVVVYWNLNGYAKTHPVKADEHGTITISGFNQAIGNSFLKMDLPKLQSMTPLTEMIDRLTSPRYSVINI